MVKSHSTAVYLSTHTCPSSPNTNQYLHCLQTRGGPARVILSVVSSFHSTLPTPELAWHLDCQLALFSSIPTSPYPSSKDALQVRTMGPLEVIHTPHNTTIGQTH